MRCTSPRTVGFLADGKTISWSQRKYSKEYPTFQLPCGKCIECRLDYARQWAVRCVHEASMYEDNCFITLTYSDENLVSPKLIYEDFQKFMKKLRKTKNEPIGCFVTGEYGEKNKRPHWHAIVFNWRPTDCKPRYKNGRGDQVYESDQLNKLWGKGLAELGSVTIESAGYCARYAAKKLVHGNDGHEYEPISKKSNKHAIGKKWLETYWEDIFNYGECRLSDGTCVPIPRYYEKWLQKHKPEIWSRYVTETKQKRINRAARKNESERVAERRANESRGGGVNFTPVITRNESRRVIQEQKFKNLQQKQKL